MELPARVSLYCPLLDAKGTPATLHAVDARGYYRLGVAIKNQTHTMLVPVAHAALVFSEPEAQLDADFELER